MFTVKFNFSVYFKGFHTKIGGGGGCGHTDFTKNQLRISCEIREKMPNTQVFLTDVENYVSQGIGTKKSKGHSPHYQRPSNQGRPRVAGERNASQRRTLNPGGRLSEMPAARRRSCCTAVSSRRAGLQVVRLSLELLNARLRPEDSLQGHPRSTRKATASLFFTLLFQHASSSPQYLSAGSLGVLEVFCFHK